MKATIVSECDADTCMYVEGVGGGGERENRKRKKRGRRQDIIQKSSKGTTSSRSRMGYAGRAAI